jgi:HEAT repeat protein
MGDPKAQNCFETEMRKPDANPQMKIMILLVGLLLLISLASKSNAQGATPTTGSAELGELRTTLAESKNADDRASAARLLAQLGDRQSIKLLVKSINDTDANVREQSILALGQLRAREAVTPLIELLKTSTEPRIKAASAFVLGLIRDRRAVDPLIAELTTAEPLLQRNITVALGLLGDRRAVGPLLSLPHDRGHQTCAPIAIALGQIKK